MINYIKKGTIKKIIRAKSSFDGNPNFKIVVDGIGVIQTKNDSMLNYSINPNMENKTYEFHIAEYSNSLRLVNFK